MANQQEVAIRNLFVAIREVLSQRRIAYIEHKIGYKVQALVDIDGYSIPLLIEVDRNGEKVVFAFKLPVVFEEEDRAIAAVATCYMNDEQIAGYFRLHAGKIFYQRVVAMQALSHEEELFKQYLEEGCTVIARYLRALRRLAEKEISLKHFLTIQVK